MNSVFRIFRRRRNVIWIFVVAALTLCAVSSASTLAVCRLQTDHPELQIEETISGFLGQQLISTQVLMRQSEQRVDQFLGLFGQPDKGAWNQGVYICHQGDCHLQWLRLEISIQGLFPCWGEYGTDLGSVDLIFDLSENSLRGATYWYDRPLPNSKIQRLSEITPTMDDVVMHVLAENLPRTVNADLIRIEITAGVEQWRVRGSDVHGTVLFEDEVNFSMN